MSGIQTKNGKAFEYACLKALQDVLSSGQLVEVDEDAAYRTAKSSYDCLPSEIKDKMYEGAFSAVCKLRAMEPMLDSPGNSGALFLKIQTDDNGKRGDVRDVLCIRNMAEHWEMGISCKHNHHAVKHSRLSSTIDFGYEWIGVHCSENYFSKVQPIFDDLKNKQRNAKIEGNVLTWKDIQNKQESIYIPVLQAFLDELKHLSEIVENAPAKFTSYLLGTKDFYKVIMDEKKETTRIEAVNINGSLNKKSGNVKSRINIPRLKMPTKFLEMGFKRNSKTTIEVVLDEGWSFSMRIHSGDGPLKPSLKFDVNLIACPSNNYAQVEFWHADKTPMTGT